MSSEKYSIEEILNNARKLREKNGDNSVGRTATALLDKEPDVATPPTSATVSINNSNGETRKTIVKIINKGLEQPIYIKNASENEQNIHKIASQKASVDAKSNFKISQDETLNISSEKLLTEIREKKVYYTSVSDATLPRNMDKREKDFSTQDANADTMTLTINCEDLKRLAPSAPKNPMQIHREQIEKTISIDKLRFDQMPTKGIKDSVSLNMYSSDQATESFPAIVPRDDFSYTTPKNARAVVQQKNELNKSKNKRFIKDSVMRKNEKTTELLFSKEPPKTIERPAVIKGRTKFEKTGDLYAIPEIMSVEDFQNSDFATQKVAAASPAKPNDTYAVQIKLDGFEDHLSDIPKIQEEDAEKDLYQRRKKRIGEFRLSDKHKLNEDYTNYFEYSEETEINTERLDDYNSPRDKESLLNHFSLKSKRLSIKSIATGILTLMMVFFSLLSSIDLLPMAFNDTYVFTIFMCIAGGLSMIFNIGTIGSGFAGLFRWKIDTDFPLAIATVCVIAHTAFAFVSEDFISSGYSIFMMALSFGFLCNNIGKQVLLKRIRSNFDFMTSQGDKYTVSNIEDQKDITVMCNGLLMGEPIVKRSVRTAFSTDFLKIAYGDEPSDKLCRHIAPFTILFSLIIGAVSFYVGKDWMSAFTATTCAICLSVPVSALLISNIKLLDVFKVTKSRGAMINGYTGAEKMADANAIVFDASNLFPAGSCDFHGVKTFGGNRIDDAILQTAAVVINTQGPLKDVFSKVVVGKHSILPEVDSIVYEERMGTSAWIFGKKVLVGNRQLMLQHGVHMPSEEFEKKYKHDNRCLLYLTVAGKLVAMFVVSYTANSVVKKELNRLEKSGMTVLVRTTDSNIDEEMLTKEYDLVDGFVRVLNTSSGRVFEKYSSDKVNEAPAYVVHNGTADAFISTMYASDILNNSKNILSILQIFGIAISLALVAVFAIYGVLTQITPLTVVLFQSVWSLFILFISKLKK